MELVAYPLLTMAGLLLTALLWPRVESLRGAPVHVFVGGLLGAAVGAKLGYFICGAPFERDPATFWQNLLTGRTVLGALLGGTIGVEVGKRWIGYARDTGDGFAIVVPISISVGRIGCLIHGCCGGVPCSAAWYTLYDASGVARWPAPIVEIGFNLTFAAIAWTLRKRGIARGQLFHIFLMSYGVFRFAHEFARVSPRVFGPITSYQMLALVLVAFGVVRFRQRARRGERYEAPALSGGDIPK